MAAGAVLTIAVPIFNMERWLDKNLATYCHPSLEGRLEVLCLNNASEDNSKAICEHYVAQHPAIFKLFDRPTRGYGGAINDAIAVAGSRYFRIVDADDWVDTDGLVALVDALEDCQADVAVTDYQIVNMTTGEMTPIRAGDKGVTYGQLCRDFSAPAKSLPTIHMTTYKTQLLRDHGFQMPDGKMFVDEEYVITPYLHAETVIHYPFDVVRYQVANPAQSTSPKNRARLQDHRELVLLRTIRAWQTAGADNPAHAYCTQRICRGIGDHFTTLYIYEEDKKKGRALAHAWKETVMREAPELWPAVGKKAALLAFLNRLHVTLPQYEALKRWLL